MSYSTILDKGSHWSLRVKKGTQMKIVDKKGQGNLAMLFYNPNNLLERYNAPDTLKCQYTFLLQKGNCLYSDMGHIFASIVEDSFGRHETISGVSYASHIEKWGKRDYQKDKNDWLQNGYDSFITELAKYGMDKRNLCSNVNWFSSLKVDESGKLNYFNESKAGDSVTLRFEIDTLVIMHTCPHPLLEDDKYPDKPIQITLDKAQPIQEDDFCKNFCEANKRGFQNNSIYNMEF